MIETVMKALQESIKNISDDFVVENTQQISNITQTTC